MKLAFDIETNGLLPDVDTVHCIVAIDLETGKEYTEACSATSMYEHGVLRLLQDAELIVGHNIIDYDIPVLEELMGADFSGVKILDTLVASKLAFGDIKIPDVGRAKSGKLPPRMIGMYSLASFGYRLGILKGDFGATTDWQEYTPEMLEYCIQDVRVTCKLYKKIMEIGISEDALELEQEVRKIVSRQTRHGFTFDSEAGMKLYAELASKRLEIEEETNKFFGDFEDSEVFWPKVNNKTRGYVKGEPFLKEWTTKFNLGSRQHIARALQDTYGWKPKVFTETGIPKIDEKILAGLEYEGAQKIGQYFLIQKRLGMLGDGKNAWLTSVRDDGRIHGQVDTLGAVTGRMTHNRPNVAQTPAGYSPYGHECRSLFTSRAGWDLIGADASGIELRCLGHYMARYDDGAYCDIILNGDIHTANMEALGITDRDVAKTFIYAFLYGAGVSKLAKILKVSDQKATVIKKNFLASFPALAELLLAVKSACARGYLLGLDGRHIPVRSEHAALNTLLQGAGALIMKRALVISAPNVYASGAEFVANIHDEFQVESDSRFSIAVGEYLVKGIVEAGEYYNFRCPLDGEYKIGKTWAETH